MSTQHLPAQPFFQTPEQRAALARQRFFEEQEHPAGLVSDAVIRSWGRSRSQGHHPHKMPALDPVNRSALSATLSRNRRLLDAAQGDLQQLEATLAGTASRLMLTDAAGVIVHVSRGAGDPQQKVLDVATRVGVNLAEGVLGTTAPGIVVQTGMACTVQGCEHFYDLFGGVRCAAAPIRDVHGRLVGVLDVSTEARGFGFDAAAVVGVYATSIENRLLQAQSDQHLVLHFQAAPMLLGTPMEGLAGVDGDGTVVWINPTGRSLVGPGAQQGPTPVEELFGTPLHHLLALCDQPDARRMQLPNGLGIWVRTTLGLRNGIDFRHAVACAGELATGEVASSTGTPPSRPEPSGEASGTSPDEIHAEARPSLEQEVREDAPSLAQAQQQLIEDALRSHGGNVARTARQLGVSRGLVYRHLRR